MKSRSKRSTTLAGSGKRNQFMVGGVKNVSHCHGHGCLPVQGSGRHAGPGPGSTTAGCSSPHATVRWWPPPRHRSPPSFSCQPTNQPTSGSVAEPQNKWLQGQAGVPAVGAGWRRLGWEILTIAAACPSSSLLFPPYLGRHHDHGRRSCEVGGGRRHCHPV